MHSTRRKKLIWKATYCMIPTIWNSRKVTTMETIKRWIGNSGLIDETIAFGMDKQWDPAVYHRELYLVTYDEAW